MSGKTKFIYDNYWHERIKASKNVDNNNKSPNEIFEAASWTFKGGVRILDLGCGEGGFSLYIKKFKKIFGAEIALEVAQIARQKSMILSLMDINGLLPYRDNIFDAISCLEVVEHLFDPVCVLKEIYRILKPNGQLVLTTPNIRYFRNLYRLIIKGEFPHTSTETFAWDGGHLHYFTRKDLYNLLREAGFEKIDFHIYQDQFRRSKKRKLIRFLIGEKTFGEWFCGSITVSAYKEP